MLLPGNVKECFEFAYAAFDLAERLQTPIFVLSDLDLGMNNWMSEPFDYPTSPLDRGKVLTPRISNASAASPAIAMSTATPSAGAPSLEPPSQGRILHTRFRSQRKAASTLKARRLRRTVMERLVAQI
jgi:hypothetical protein